MGQCQLCPTEEDLQNSEVGLWIYETRSFSTVIQVTGSYYIMQRTT